MCWKQTIGFESVWDKMRRKNEKKKIIIFLLSYCPDFPVPRPQYAIAMQKQLWHSQTAANANSTANYLPEHFSTFLLATCRMRFYVNVLKLLHFLEIFYILTRLCSTK
jgi:hypothetical protein